MRRGLSLGAMAVVGLGLFSAANIVRMEAARALVERAGPSEFSLGLVTGWNARCGSMVAVSFWQQGPRVPERQGYICDGVFAPARMVVVPFESGIVLVLDV